MTSVPDSFYEIVQSTQDRVTRVERLYFEQLPFAFSKSVSDVGDIRAQISRHFGCPYRSVVFCGSAQLGFSPTKDTAFKPGYSDLDVAITDGRVFETVWQRLLEASRGFTNLSVFGVGEPANERVTRIKEMLARRGVIHFPDLPRTNDFKDSRTFLRNLSAQYTSMFTQVSVSFYMSEYAFVWKQDAAVSRYVR